MFIGKRNIKSFSLTLLSIFSAILGVYRTRLLTNYFGANEVTDSFIIAWSIPIFIINFITGSLYLGFIPDLNHQFKSSYKDGLKLFWSINNITAIIAVLLITPLLIIPNKILSLFFNFSSPAQNSLVLTQIRILLPTILFMLLISNFNSYFSIKDKFVMPYILQNIPLVLSILGLFFHKQLGILGLSLGISLGNLIAIAILVLIFSIENSGINYYPRLNINIIEKYFAPLVPLVISQICLQLLTIIDNITATHLISGNLSILSYAVRLNEIIFQGAILTFIITIYPTISNILANKSSTINVALSVLKKINIISLFLITLIILCGRDLIDILFRSNRFDTDEIYKTWLILTILSSELMVLGWSALNQRLLILYRNYSFLAYSGLFQVCFKYLLNIWLIRIFGVYGIAISTLIVNVIWLIFSQIIIEYSHLKYFRNLWKENYRIILAGCIIIGISILLKNSFFLDLNIYVRIITCSISVFICYLFYFIVIKRYDLTSILKA